jgi:DNA polymerase-1
VGEKTAVALIKEFGSVEGLLKHVDKVPKEGLRQSIREHAQLIKLNRELVQLCSDVKLDVDIEDLACKEQDTAELYKIFKSLEFKRLLSDLPVSGEKLPSLKLEQGVPDGLIKEGGELLVSGSSLETLVFYCAGKAFKANLKQTTQILADSKIKKSGYDLKGLKVSLSHEGAKIQGFHSDAMIAAYLINPSAGDYSLAALARDYLDKHLSREALSPAESIGLIAKILPKLEEGLAERSLKDLFVNMEMPLVGVLADMEIAGVKLDLKLLLDLSVQLERRLKTLIKEIYNISGSEFNINSPKQLGEVLFEKLKLPVVKKTKTGFSTDEEVLKKLAREHELPKFLLEYRQLTKLKTTYIDTLPELADKEGSRLHTSFNQTGTETGRLSSSNPNLQNIPVKTEVGRSIRQAITSSGKGYYLLSCDYSQVELRILAHLSRDRELVEAFKKGKDIHKATAALVNGIPEEEVTDEMRELAKRVNFGIVYGQTGFGLSRDLGISLGEAQGFIDEYFARYPGVKDYVEEQMRKAQEDGFVTTISGRRRYLPEIKSKNMGLRQFAQRQAVNTPLQGSAADLIKLAMIDIARSLEGLKLKSQMVLQIHDELLFDVPEDELDEMAKLVREKMEHVLKLSIPLKVDIKKGRNWLEMDSV